MKAEESLPQVTITIDREKHCWCIKLGSHLIPIRQGRYSEAVAAYVVASEIRALSDGPVTVTTES
jgi:hypothetical protein